HLMYKELLNSLEERAPGSKAAFLNGFSDRLMPLLDDLAERERDAVGTRARCGSPTTAAVCAVCRLRDQATRPPRRGRQLRAGNRPGRRDEEKPQKAQTEKTGAPEPSVGS